MKIQKFEVLLEHIIWTLKEIVNTIQLMEKIELELKKLSLNNLMIDINIDFINIMII
jgi:hypothetical protein